MDFINISKKRYFEGKIIDYSSEENEANTVKNLLKEGGYWKSNPNHDFHQEYFIIDLGEPVVFDSIEILPSPVGGSSFPKDFRFEGSNDKNIWEIIHCERNYEIDADFYSLDLPLTEARYLKLVIPELNSDSQYFVEIGQFKVGISGILDITASSEKNNEYKAQNVIGDGFDSCWESKNSNNSIKESLVVDLGKVYHINRIVIGSSDYGFPENFYVEVSTDNNIWAHLFEEKKFIGEPKTKYIWDIDVTPVQYIRFEATGTAVNDSLFGVRLSLLEISGAHYNRLHTHNIGELTPYGSVFQPGIVKLSKDGDDKPGTAVQGSDSRLRDATTIFKGIVQLAEDGEIQSGSVVQSSDSRLQPASELQPGIVRLSYDRENKAGTVVQGNDSRLQEATDSSFGIVKLCSDGQYNEGSVVTGNDSRLQVSTVESFGICKLAPNGSDDQNCVVQANDKRLRNATIAHKGIVELAEDGEDAADVVVQGNDKRLKDANTQRKGIVELAEDGEDAANVVIQGNDKRLKDATIESKGIVELAEDGEDAADVVVQGNDKRLKDATIHYKGIVELAEDGEDSPAVVVQGNDRRLKDATETSKGILRFASDGETSNLSAVQGNDKRLRDATTTYKGIVELAEDGEVSPNVAVQGNDKRLKDATTEAKGIVELAKDGEDRPNVAVQGNDMRLKDATEQNKGIMQFAENEEIVPYKAVQANDKRLRNGTVTYKGIVELADDGENAPNVVVQGNDKRLKDATTQSKGIVELAEDGEDSSGVVVQGNDKRLKEATDKTYGIVKFAKHNAKLSKLAVQADDARLYDDRNPLPHDHEYAVKDHNFNSHGGTISISASKNDTFKEITPPSDNSAIIYGKNSSKNSGSIGITGIAGVLDGNAKSYGVVGHSKHIGVRGQSSGGDKQKGCGIMGISRFGPGGLFSSEHTFAVIADGYGSIQEYDDSINLIGKGEALSVNGKSDFNGPIFIKNQHGQKENNYPANVCELFEVDEEEYISPGDLLVVSDQGGALLSRSRTEYNKSVIGIVSGNPTVVLNNSGKEQKIYPVALAGKVMCKVDARNNPINPGDLIVASETPGCGMVGVIDNFNKIGTVIGKALDKLEEGTGLIPVFISHM